MNLHYHNKVSEFIKSLPKQSQAKTLHKIILLEKYGHDLGMPHVKKLTPELYELRIRGTQEIRLLFTFQNQACYIMHGFIKKTQQTPIREIITAKNRLS